MTSQYQGGFGLASQAMFSTPNQPRTVFIMPKRTPLKIDIFQISEAATKLHAVGRKKTDRKNAFMKRSRCTISARPSDSAQVTGTMIAAKTVKVTSDLVKSPFVSINL